MEGKPVRSVLGIYAADEGESAKAYDALRAQHLGDARLFRADETAEPSKRDGHERYAALRLEGECLIVAAAAASEVPAIVGQLQRIGSPAVFVVWEKGLSDVAVPEIGTASPGSEPIEDVARRCAEHRGKPGTAKPRMLSRLLENERTLEASRCDLAEAARLEHALTAAAEWLLDNGYLIRTQIAEIRHHLPRNHHRIFPAGVSGDPYICELTKELVVHTDHSLNEVNIRDCLRAYQQVAPLTIAELWSVPLLLRMALIGELTQLALQVSRRQQLREACYFWANRLSAASRRGAEVFERMLRLMEAEPVALEPYFMICLAEQLQGEEDALAPIQHWVEERLKTPLTEMVRTEHTREAAECISTANAFDSLRVLSRIDFTTVFESVSLMEAELRSDPSGTYARSDFATRDRCRRAVERISRHSGRGELDVARLAIALARQGTDPRTQQVSYYLLADGVAQLEAETNARIPFGTAIIRGLRSRATVVYLSGIAGLTLCFTMLALAVAWDAGVRQEGYARSAGNSGIVPTERIGYPDHECSGHFTVPSGRTAQNGLSRRYTEGAGDARGGTDDVVERGGGATGA
jgi:cyclic beta-1,2-glucan synthetase